VGAPRGVEARPPRGVSEDTDEVGTDAPPEFRQATQAIIVVDVRGGAEDRVAQVPQTHQIEDRELLVRGFYKEVDVAVFPGRSLLVIGSRGTLSRHLNISGAQCEANAQA
jgi:hypothetical protein